MITQLFIAPAGECILFTDALRFDLGQRLAEQLEQRGFACTREWRLAPLPPITATAKPAVSPAAGALSGEKAGLVPHSRETGTAASTELLRRLIREQDYQELKGEERGDPGGRAWAEYGAIDRYGHDHGWKIAHHVQAELQGLAGRIISLLNQGWQTVTVVTDHGWLLLPGGLPKAELPQHLTLTRKGRCAVLKPGATTDQLTVPWHWNPAVTIAIAPDIHCFEAGKTYEHGGLSPQECVVPVLRVGRAAAEAGAVVIEAVKWAGLRCTIQLAGGGPELQVDIRARAGDATTSLVAEPKSPDEQGRLSMLVPDEELEGNAAFVVVLRGEGLQAQQLTVIGGE